MRLQGLSPTMQDAEEPDLGAEMFRICRHFQQSGSGGIEQKGEQDLFVLPHQWDKQVRHAEDEMKIVHRQQLLLALGEPLLASVGLAFRTMPIPTANGVLSVSCLMGSIFYCRVGSAVCCSGRLNRISIDSL